MKQVLNANCNNFLLKGDVTLLNVTTKFFNYLKKKSSIRHVSFLSHKSKYQLRFLTLNIRFI